LEEQSESSENSEASEKETNFIGEDDDDTADNEYEDDDECEDDNSDEEFVFPKKKMKKSFFSQNTLNIKTFTPEEYVQRFLANPVSLNESVVHLQNSYFNQLLELTLGGKGTLAYREIKKEESYKKRMLEVVLLIPWLKIVKEGFEKILKEVFRLGVVEIAKALECLKLWLSCNDSEIPHSSSLLSGCYQYWQWLEHDTSGWQWLSKVALLFCNTLPSESSVERDLSKVKLMVGSLRYRSSNKSLDAEIRL
jgi:hypothetical protein